MDSSQQPVSESGPTDRSEEIDSCGHPLLSEGESRSRIFSLREEHYVLRKRVAELRFKLRACQSEEQSKHSRRLQQDSEDRQQRRLHQLLEAEIRQRRDLLAALQNRLRGRLRAMPRTQHLLDAPQMCPPAARSHQTSYRGDERMTSVELRAAQQERMLLEEQLARETLRHLATMAACEISRKLTERRVAAVAASRQRLEALADGLQRAMQLRGSTEGHSGSGSALL
jgi:hypothetical protein